MNPSVIQIWQDFRVAEQKFPNLKADDLYDEHVCKIREEGLIE